jgi:outer membrane lipase/esterase
LDPNRILGAILADPTKFGFNASTLNIGATACGINPTPVNLPGDFYNSSQTCVNNNPNNYLFADSVHPTTQAHDIFAAILMGSLRAIGQASYLATGPMISARQHAMELENRLHLNAFSKADGKSRPVGDTQVYGGAESGGFKQGSGQIDPSVDLSSQRYRIGIDQQLTSSVMGGALFTYGQSKTDFGSNTGEIKTNEVSAVLYASKALSANTYINASFGMGTIDHSFRREIALDTTTLVSRSSPKGEYESFRIGGGAVYEVNGWRIGPSASFALENVTIDQFDENQGPSSMSFGKIDYSVQRLTAGLSLDQIASVGQWRGFGRLVHDWDLKSGDLEIKVGPDSSTLAKFDIDRPGKTMWQATLGIMRPATDGSTLSFSVGFGGREGGGDTKTIGVNYRIEL